MSGIAPSELFLIVVIGLIILGPKRLPQVANQLGSWLGQARRMTRMMKRQLEDEINLDLDSINKPVDIEKGLGLKDDPKPTPVAKKDADVSRPEYVHERRHDDSQVAGTDEAAESPAETSAKEPPELPDDYSPAHGPDDLGTGVSDSDSDSDNDNDSYDEGPADVPDAVVASDDKDDVAEPPKKETA